MFYVFHLQGWESKPHGRLQENPQAVWGVAEKVKVRWLCLSVWIIIFQYHSFFSIPDVIVHWWYLPWLIPQSHFFAESSENLKYSLRTFSCDQVMTISAIYNKFVKILMNTGPKKPSDEIVNFHFPSLAEMVLWNDFCEVPDPNPGRTPVVLFNKTYSITFWRLKSIGKRREFSLKS